MTPISKELMIEIFNDIDYDQSFIQQPEYGASIRYVDIYGNSELLDAYYVMHLMKEFIFAKGFRNSSGIFTQDDGKKEYFYSIDKWTWHSYESEFEAVKIGCEFMLKEQNV